MALLERARGALEPRLTRLKMEICFLEIRFFDHKCRFSPEIATNRTNFFEKSECAKGPAIFKLGPDLLGLVKLEAKFADSLPPIRFPTSTMLTVKAHVTEWKIIATALTSA